MAPMFRRLQPAQRSRTIVAAIAFSLFVDYFFYGIAMTLMPLSPAGIGEGQLGLLYGSYAASVLLLTPLCAYLGGRVGGRATMILGAVLAACSIALFGAAGSLLSLFAARFCQGAASAAVWTAGLALVAECSIDNRVEMIGYAFTGGAAGSVLGPVVSGVLYRIGGYRLPFLAAGVLAALAVCLLTLFLPAKRSRGGRIEIRALLANRSVAQSALAVALAAFAWGVIEPLLRPNLGGVSPETLGLMFAASSVTYGLCAPFVRWICERAPAKKVVLTGTLAMAALLPLLAVFERVLPIAAALCLINCAFAFMMNPASAELGNEVDRAGTSSYFAAYAVYNIVYSVGMLATTAITATVARTLGFFHALLCVSAVLLVCMPLLMLNGAKTYAYDSEHR